MGKERIQYRTIVGYGPPSEAAALFDENMNKALEQGFTPQSELIVAERSRGNGHSELVLVQQTSRLVS